jgi:hypothetical protein
VWSVIALTVCVVPFVYHNLTDFSEFEKSCEMEYVKNCVERRVGTDGESDCCFRHRRSGTAASKGYAPSLSRR